MIQIKEDNGKQLVDARELHAFLGVGKMFANWIKDRIEQYGFAEGTDYVVLEGLPKLASEPHNKKDYAITLDMAKEIAMLERNEKGREARRYFIECEKKLKDLQQPMDELEMIAAMIKSQLEQRASMKALEASVDTLSEKVAAVEQRMRVDDEFLTVSGFLALTKAKPTPVEVVKAIGMEAARYCRENGIPISQIPSAKWGKVNAYPKDVLEVIIRGRA